MRVISRTVEFSRKLDNQPTVAGYVRKRKISLILLFHDLPIESRTAKSGSESIVCIISFSPPLYETLAEHLGDMKICSCVYNFQMCGDMPERLLTGR